MAIVSLMLAVAWCAAGAPQQPPALVPLLPLRVHLDGWLGERVEHNRVAWLDAVDLAPRLEPFEHRPAKQAWAGEHVGKWLAAAATAWQDSGDAVLKQRLDGAAAALLACQEDDGYLGAYLKDQRFQLLPGADWDVWTIKYALLGLLEYHAATGDERALSACRRAADLLLQTFAPGQRSILSAGTHVGMAATSVLEPIVKLYRATHELRYLDFARRIVQAWDEPGGPRIAAALGEHRRVARVANGKAYEMLSNLVGLCELYRVTGSEAFLRAPEYAFEGIVGSEATGYSGIELLPTGSMSSHEHFLGGGRLPDLQSANLAETCVTVTWLQLCRELFELTGQEQYGREIERTVCNHLLAAQRPDGAAWCYFTPLRGKKPYDQSITCCSSSGPRGLAMLPQCAAFVGRDGALVVNLPLSMHGEATLGGQRVSFTLASGLPRAGVVRLAFACAEPARFAVWVRLSEWAMPAVLRVGGDERTVERPGFCVIGPRTWRDGDAFELQLRCELTPEYDANDLQRVALRWGSCVLALPDDGPDAATPGFDAAAAAPRLLDGPALRVECGLQCGGGVLRRVLLPFADVGADGGGYRVWLANRSAAVAAASEARSRAGNVQGSIADGDGDTCVVTFDGTRADEDWYSVAFAAPVAVDRVVFAHGHAFHDGGWFDSSHGKPRVQVRVAPGADWQTVGELAGYPATTAQESKGLRDGQQFVLQLGTPVTAVEVRVLGVPACGDDARQAFSSCAELAACTR